MERIAIRILAIYPGNQQCQNYQIHILYLLSDFYDPRDETFQVQSTIVTIVKIVIGYNQTENGHLFAALSITRLILHTEAGYLEMDKSRESLHVCETKGSPCISKQHISVELLTIGVKENQLLNGSTTCLHEWTVSSHVVKFTINSQIVILIIRMVTLDSCWS